VSSKQSAVETSVSEEQQANYTICACGWERTGNVTAKSSKILVLYDNTYRTHCVRVKYFQYRNMAIIDKIIDD